MFGRARALRRPSTRAEFVLWRHLRDRQVAGCKFVRQEPIGPYFADFVCRERHLVVVVDGGQHADSAGDAVRDAAIATSDTGQSGSGTTTFSAMSRVFCKC
jgi:very-short-patch-repair endonuclease